MSLKYLQSECKNFVDTSPQSATQIIYDVVFCAAFDSKVEIYRDYITFIKDKVEK